MSQGEIMKYFYPHFRILEYMEKRIKRTTTVEKTCNLCALCIIIAKADAQVKDLQYHA